MSVENNIEQKSTKNEKVSIKKYTSPTIRLTLTLREPDEESCSVFNYNLLIAEEKRKRRREKEQHQLNGFVEEPEEDDSDVKRLAQHFEEKYGGVSAKKKRKKRAPKFYNYTDLAAGYDESDSFIDNSEAFDEALPDDMETAFGGYYVNTGQLELKKVEIPEENSDLDDIRVTKRKNCVLKSDGDSSSDGDVVKSDDDDSKTDDDEVESVTKKLPEETNHNEAEPVDPPRSSVEITKSTLLKEKLNHTIKINGELLVKKKKKYKKRHLADENQDEAPKLKKKAVTVKSMLEEKRIVENGDGTANGSSKPAENTFSSINDVIESVVNAARNRSEDSRDSTSSSSDTKSIDSLTSYETEKEIHTDESTNVVSNVSKTGSNEQVKLPDNLSAEVLELISYIKKSIQNSEPTGARSLFKSSVDSKLSVNSKLLELESQVRSMKSASRHALYEYLAHFLPCSKDTLMKRAKKLLIEEEERLVTEPLKKLKASIDKIMPSLLDSYIAACQKVAEEKNMNDLENGDIDERKTIASKMPPMKFVWTEETRGYLRELVSCRLKCFHTLKPRKESAEEYVKKFLETKVKPLWPAGWMETSILMKEAQCCIIPKVKKLSSTSSANGSVTGAGCVLATTTTAIVATATATTTVTSASTKKPPQTSVPSSANSVSNAAVGSNAANYNFLAKPLTLQSMAIPYPTQTDVSYSAAPSTGIPYRSDLSMMASLPPSNVPLPRDLMAHIALVNSHMSATATQPSYSKSTRPPKKSTTPTPSYSVSRSTTPVSNAAASVSTSYPDKKKADASSSKFNEMFKIDSLINTGSKVKKEHHMLNHISQYNKHYSHKTEKRKTNSKKSDYVPIKNAVNHNSNSASSSAPNINSNKTTSPNVVNLNNTAMVEPNRKSGARDQVLDLSPNKVKEIKCDMSDHQVVSRTEVTPVQCTSVTAKDHNYWAGASEKAEPKEKSVQDFQSQSRLSFSSHESGASKTTHISRKQRLLQESTKCMAQAVSDSFITKHAISSESVTKRSEKSVRIGEEFQAVVPEGLCPYDDAVLNENEDKLLPGYPRKSHLISNLVSAKIEEKLSNFDEKRNRLEETATGTDLLSKIINDSLQNPSSQFNSNLEKGKLESERKSEERVISPPILFRPSSRDSLSSVGSLSAERKTPNSETADLIQELVTLNQIGGHSIPRRVDYQDSKKPSDFSNGSMMSQSSLHLSDKNKSSSLPRVDFPSPFQREFFKHLSKLTTDGSPSYTTNSKSQDKCFTSELPSLEVDGPLSLNLTNATLKQGNPTAYQQSVIMPPASARWYKPESKS